MTKPTLTTLAIGLLVLASSASFSQDTLRNKKPTEISIIEAIEKEMLDVVVSGSYDSRIFREVVDANGIYYGKCMSIVLKSKIDTFVLLRLDCGMKLVPSDTFFQTMIATQKAVFPFIQIKFMLQLSILCVVRCMMRLPISTQHLVSGN